MVLSRPLRSPKGEVIIPAETELRADLISKLRRYRALKRFSEDHAGAPVFVYQHSEPPETDPRQMRPA